MLELQASRSSAVAPPALGTRTPVRRAARAESASSRLAMLALPAQEAWVGTARSFVSFLVRHWRLSEDERDSAVLIVGELAANAAQHGHCDMVLSLALHADTLHITVTDSGGPRSAGRLQVDPEERGRGIQIVESLATWTVILQGEHGRRVHAGLEVERESAECP